MSGRFIQEHSADGAARDYALLMPWGTPEQVLNKVALSRIRPLAPLPRRFLGYCANRLIFYNATRWVFTGVYAGFGVLVVLAFWLAPPDHATKHDLAAGQLALRALS